MFEASDDKSNVHFNFTSGSYTINVRSVLRGAYSNIVTQSRGRFVLKRLEDFRFTTLLSRNVVNNFLFFMNLSLFHCFLTSLIVGELCGRPSRQGGSLAQNKENCGGALRTEELRFTNM